MWATIKVGMNRSKLQVALLAGILVLANAQCLFACAAEPCIPPPSNSGHSLPPCHKQHQPAKQDEAPPACAHAPILGEYRAPATVAVNLVFATRVMDCV